VSLVEHSELRSAILDSALPRRQLDWLLEISTLFLFDGQVCASRYLERHFSNWMRRLRSPAPLLYSPYAYNPALLCGGRKNAPRLESRYRGLKCCFTWDACAKLRHPGPS
jgi:hypothetical protein